MSHEWMKTRQTKFTAYATTYILVVVAVLVAVNWLANRYPKSYDATSNKRYSLSDQTIKVVKGLKEPVSISYFDDTGAFNGAKDLLDRYDALSSNLKVSYIDPIKKPQIARQYGVRARGSIIIERGDRRQEARSLTEEDVTSALIRVLKTAEKTVCFTTGEGEHSTDDTEQDGYSGAKEALTRDNYKVQTINLLEKPEVPGACTAVVIGGPHTDYPQPVVDKIKSYVENKGRVLFLLDPPIDAGKARYAENTALVQVLAGWGVTLNKDLVLETSGIGQLYGLGAETALATQYGTHPIVREMKRSATAVPLTRSLIAKPTDKTSVEKLISTSDSSVATTQLSSLSQKIDPSKLEAKSYDVAAAGSYRTGTPNEEGRFVVVGSSDWIANYALRFAGNRDLFLNMMNWLSNDEDLISIRPKDPEDRRIELTRNQMYLVRVTSQFLIPLGVILAGAFVWLKRR